MPELPNIRLDLSNRPENVLLVRQALSGVAQAIGLDGVTLNDLATAVTEACNNVVLHAYEGEEGPLEVEMQALGDVVAVTVRDRGTGIHEPISSAQETTSGIGMPIIHALARHVELNSCLEGGTEVRMEFATPGTRPLETPAQEAFEFPTLEPSELPTTMRVMIAPPQLEPAVLPRLLSVLAARAHLPTDRLPDAELLSGALIEYLGSSRVLTLRLDNAL